MKKERYLKITVKTTIGVYLPKDGGADRAVTKEALLARLLAAGDWSSDGRRHFCVEQFQVAAETIVRGSIKRLVDDHYRGKGLLQKAIESGSQDAVEFVRDNINDAVVLAMSHVSLGETPVSEEHVLEFEIEE